MPAPLRPSRPGTAPPSPHGLVVLHRSRKKPLDAIAFLKADHKRVAALFERYKKWASAPVGSRKAIGDEIRDELALHSRIEEQLFYPLLARVESPYVRDLVREADEEHGIVDRLVAELALIDPEDGRYGAKLKVLRQNVERHVADEQSRVFPAARRWLGEPRLLDLGREMTAFRKALRTGTGRQVVDAATALTKPVEAVAVAAIRGFEQGLKRGAGALKRRRPARLRPAARRKTRPRRTRARKTD